jgi:hypothetical protein
MSDRKTQGEEGAPHVSDWINEKLDEFEEPDNNPLQSTSLANCISG